jgi:hypothetical protein
MDAVMQRPIGRRTTAWIGLVLSGAIIHAVLWQISAPTFLFNDFHKAYYPVAELLLHKGPQPTWWIDNTSEVRFVNIPIVAWLFVPLVPLGKAGAGWVFLALGIAATAGAWMLLVRLGRPEAMIGAALLFFFLVNGPLVNSLRAGNTTHFILLFLVIALLLWNSRWEYAAGLVLGICAVIKLPLLLYGVYFVFRRRWRVVAGGATMIGLSVILSLAVFGLEITVAWYEYCVEPFLGRIIPAFNVQSIDGFLMRLHTGSNYFLYWGPVEPTAIHKIFRVLLFAGIFGGAFWLLRRPDGREQKAHYTGALGARHFLEYALVLDLALVMSPLSWTHYYLLLLLPWGLYLGGLLALPDDATTRWLMRSGLLLSSLPVVFFPMEPGWFEVLMSRIAFSAWLFGGLCMLAAMARGSWRMTQPAVSNGKVIGSRS